MPADSGTSSMLTKSIVDRVKLGSVGEEAESVALPKLSATPPGNDALRATGQTAPFSAGAGRLRGPALGLTSGHARHRTRTPRGR